MKVVHVNSVDVSGGAAIASNRLHTGLRENGIDSREVVARKDTADPTIDAPSLFSQEVVSRIRSVLDTIPAYLYRGFEEKLFSTAFVPSQTDERVANLDPDIIHLHWINAGFLRIEELREFDAPLVWTLHDMWPFTGGCHYSGDCTKYKNKCGNCPMLGEAKESDLSRRIWKRKQEAWDNLDITIVAPSQWLADTARSSSLFDDSNVHQIPNGIDVSTYRPLPPSTARSLYNISENKHIVLFGAANPDDPRKGYDFLTKALAKVENQWEDVELVTFGSNPINGGETNLQNVTHVGHVDEIGLIALYSAADVFVIPSLEDNLPNTVLESLACGTPVVSYDIGGIGDMISHRENGFLAEPRDSISLRDGIHWVLHNGENGRLEKKARQSILNGFELHDVAAQYTDLYCDLIEG